MKEYRITKYNTIYRNEDGHYLKDEWTDVSDVGKIIKGVKVSEDDYIVRLSLAHFRALTDNIL